MKIKHITQTLKYIFLNKYLRNLTNQMREKKINVYDNILFIFWKAWKKKMFITLLGTKFLFCIKYFDHEKQIQMKVRYNYCYKF